MADSKRDTLSADRALFHFTSSYISASNGNYPRPWQPIAPCAPPTQFPLPTWTGNPSSCGAYHQLPKPDANVAQSASSPSQVQGPRRPNYAHPSPIDYWKCCHCKYYNHPDNCPVLCVNCSHKKCYNCSNSSSAHGSCCGVRV